MFFLYVSALTNAFKGVLIFVCQPSKSFYHCGSNHHGLKINQTVAPSHSPTVDKSEEKLVLTAPPLPQLLLAPHSPSFPSALSPRPAPMQCSFFSTIININLEPSPPPSPFATIARSNQTQRLQLGRPDKSLETFAIFTSPLSAIKWVIVSNQRSFEACELVSQGL